MDPNRSNWLAILSRIVDLSARRTEDDRTPRPLDIAIVGVTEREWEYERAPHESQTAAVPRRSGAVCGSLGFGATSMMLGLSTGTVYQSGMVQSVARDSDGSVWLTTPQQQLSLPSSSATSSSAKKATPMPIPSVSGELVADSEGDVRSVLGGSFVDGAKRHPRATGVGRSIQDEEEGGLLGADACLAC